MITNVETKICKTVYLSTLLFAPETWVMLDNHTSRVTSSEMKYLRQLERKTRKEIKLLESLKMNLVVEMRERKSEMKYLRQLEGKTREGSIRSTTIRESLKMGSLVEEREKRNLKLYGHLIRMNNERKTYEVFEV